MEIDGLVEKITREVLSALQQPAASTAGAASGSYNGGQTDLVVFGGNLDELTCFLRDSGLRASAATVVLPRDSAIRRGEAESLGLARVVYFDDAQRPVDLVSGASRVWLPIYQFQQLSNLAGLCDSCWDVKLALRALTEGRAVQVWMGALQTAAPFQQKIDGYLREIQSYGIQVSGKGGASRAMSSGDAFAPPPARSVPFPEPAGSLGAASAAARPPAGSFDGANASSPCQLKAVGECGGLGQCPKHLPERVGIILEHGAERLSTQPGVGPVGPDMAKYIDHTLLKPDATREQVVKLCEEARQYSFASVCVNPGFVSLAADALRGSTVKVCTVVGFPLGATTTVSKAMETRDAVANGADEIDMVINVGALKANNDDLVRRDIEAVVEAAGGRIVKVILETALLNDEEKVRACNLSRAAGADFVKTSTGFGPGGATAHDIALMRQTVGRYMGVKASGGIRDLAVAQEMIAAGATRIGASASVPIVKGEKPAAKQAY
jgi:deoxyribose-phosphate aldolase